MGQKSKSQSKVSSAIPTRKEPPAKQAATIAATARSSGDKFTPEIRKLPVSVLVKADWNYKAEDEFVQGKLSENIRRNGQLETILVRRLDDDRYEVVNGNHRLTSLKALGVTEALVVDLGTISDTEAKRLAIELNETRFPSDSIRLSVLLNELKQEQGDMDLLETLPYDRREYDRLVALSQWSWETPDGDVVKKPKEDVPKTPGPVSEIMTFTPEQASQFAHLMGLLKARTKRSTEALVLEALQALLSLQEK